MFRRGSCVSVVPGARFELLRKRHAMRETRQVAFIAEAVGCGLPPHLLPGDRLAGHGHHQRITTNRATSRVGAETNCAKYVPLGTAMPPRSLRSHCTDLLPATARNTTSARPWMSNTVSSPDRSSLPANWNSTSAPALVTTRRLGRASPGSFVPVPILGGFVRSGCRTFSSGGATAQAANV